MNSNQGTDRPLNHSGPCAILSGFLHVLSSFLSSSFLPASPDNGASRGHDRGEERARDAEVRGHLLLLRHNVVQGREEGRHGRHGSQGKHWDGQRGLMSSCSHVNTCESQYAWRLNRVYQVRNQWKNGTISLSHFYKCIVYPAL